MKISYAFLVILTLVLLNTQFIYPQWLQSNGPGGGETNCLAFNGTNVFAGTYSGLFFSSNNGTNWAKVNSGLTNTNIRSFGTNGTNTFASTDSGVFLTTNNGTNWNKVNNGLTTNDIRSFVFSGDNIFAVTDMGVFQSTNNGTNWIQKGLTTNSVNCITIIGMNIFAGADSGVFISTNNGTNWTQTSLNENVNALAVIGNNIFAATYGGVYISTDNGLNWTKVNDSNFHTFAVIGAIIFASYPGPFGGMFRSTDNGLNWARICPYGSIRCIGSNGVNIYFSYYDNDVETSGLFLSTNSGTDWIQVGLPTYNTKALAINGTGIFAGGDNGIFLSKNDGTNWITSWVYGYNGFTNALSVIGNNIFAGTANRGMYLSTDNGITWSAISNGLNSGRIYSLAVKGTAIYLGTNGGVYLSTNDGTNWNLVSNGLPPSIFISALAVSGDNLFAGALDGGGMFLSTDNGTNWTQENTGLADTIINTIAVMGNNIFAGTDSGGVFLSTNNGANWTQINDGLGNTNIRCLTVSGDNVFAGTGSGIYFLTSNSKNWTYAGMENMAVLSLASNETYIFAGTYKASVWKRPLSDFALPVELTSFTGSAGKGGVVLKWNTATELNNMGFDVERSGNKSDWGKVGFVKGNGNSTVSMNYSYMDKSVSKAGKYFYRLKQIDNNGSYKYSSVAEVEFGAPSSYALNQNYPNPFNPSTMISYRLKDKGFVKLKIYDIKGELVKVLVNEQRDAGYYESEFDGKGLASGVYIYRLEVIGDGNKVVYSEMKKTVLLK